MNSKIFFEESLYIEIIKKLDEEILFKIINCSLLQSQDFDQMTNVLSFLIDQKFGENVLELLYRVSKSYETCRPFDKKTFSFYNDINQFNPKECFECEYNTNGKYENTIKIFEAERIEFENKANNPIEELIQIGEYKANNNQ